MATPVRWMRGPWATPGSTTQPEPMVPEAPGRAQAYQSLIRSWPETPQPGSEGGYGGPSTGPAGEYGSSGPLSGDQMQTLGDITGLGVPAAARALGAPSVVGNVGARAARTAANFGLPGLGTFLGAAKLGISGASALARALGVQQQNNPYAGLLDPLELQAYRDYFGVNPAMEAEQAAQRAAVTGAANAARAGGLPDIEAYGPPPVDVGFGYGGGGGGGETTGFDPSEPAGMGRSDPGGYDYARGGVSRVRRPTRALYGEREPEEAIFIPQSMRRPGMQGREREVRSGLKSAYGRLTGGRQIRPGG